MSTHDPRDPRVNDNVHVVPREMDGMAGLLDKQDDHYRTLLAYATDTCGRTAGLKGLMSRLSGPISELSDLFVGRYSFCQRRMAVTAHGLRMAKEDFVGTDEESARDLREVTMFDPVPAGMSSVHILPSSSRYIFTATYEQSYDDTWEAPGQADQGDGAFLNSIVQDASHQLHATVEVFNMQQPHAELISTILTPILGDYKQLAAYQSAYEQLGNSTYGIAENLRRGLVRIGPRWNGDASDAFEIEALRWSEGTGGLGDTAECAGQLFQWLYNKVAEYITKIVKHVGDMFDQRNNILDVLARTPGAYAYYAMNGVRCTPVKAPGMSEADAVELAHHFHRLLKAFVAAFRLVEKLADLYDDAVGKARTIINWFSNAHGDFGQYVADTLYLKLQNRALNFERPHGEYSRDDWNPRLGAWRIGVLPGA